jgi:phosphatidate cytidylyltransferase
MNNLRKTNVLKQRIITALILAPLMLGGIFFLPLYEFKLFIGLITCIGAWEWANFAGIEKQVGRITYAVVLSAVVFAVSQLPAEYQLPLLYVALVWWILAFVLVRSYPQSSHYWHATQARLLLGFIVLLPMWIGFVQLKTYGLSDFLIFYVMLIVWGADVGAYFAGRTFGKNKLAPNVSPGKTWEGVYGGLMTTLLIAIGGGYCLTEYTNIVLDPLKWAALIAVTLLVTMVSVLGDLVESMLKRYRGIKDSSQLLPGHGGIMDRIDSMTAAVPVFALALTWLQWNFN